MFTLKVPTNVFADNILLKNYNNYSEKVRFDILCELSAWQTIHMKYQALFSLKIKQQQKHAFLNVGCCSCYGCFKGLKLTETTQNIYYSTLNIYIINHKYETLSFYVYSKAGLY